MSETEAPARMDERPVNIDLNPFCIRGLVRVPPGARGLVLFAHASGLARPGPLLRRARAVFEQQRLATAVFDHIARNEEIIEEDAALEAANLGLLAGRIVGTLDELAAREDLRLPIALFAVGRAASAALSAASERGAVVRALITLDADLSSADAVLPAVTTPALLLALHAREPGVGAHEGAFARLGATQKRLHIPDERLKSDAAIEEALALAAAWLQERVR